MSDKLKTNLYKYGTSAAFAALAAYAHIWLNEGFAQMPRLEQYRILCDAFTIPGVTLIMLGLLMWISSQGTLDGLGYVAKTGLRLLIPGKGLDKPEKYADYVMRKRGTRVKGYGFLFISGLVTLAVAMVFLVLFYIAR